MKKHVGMVFGVIFFGSLLFGVGYGISKKQTNDIARANLDKPINQLISVVEPKITGSSLPKVAGIDEKRLEVISFEPLEVNDLQEKFVIQFVGDVMLGRSVNGMIKRYRDVDWPFLEIKDYLSQADVLIGNLESSLIEDCPSFSEGFIFCSAADNVAGLKNAGFAALSVENNHILNFGHGGRTQTIEALEKSGIAAIEHDQTTVLERDGRKIHLIAFDDVTSTGKRYVEENWESAISQTRLNADITVVLVHWGEEYSTQPTARQIELAHRAISAGADIVVGAHPHVVQPAEIYDGRLIFYSLGNFVFDQMWSEGTKNGVLAQVVFGDDNQIFDVRMAATFIENFGQVRLK